MLDTVTFVKRLELIISHYELSSAAFADRIDVQRSSISHLLNGRNKPSLEFVMKIVDRFPEVDLHWLLYAKGSFPSTAMNSESPKQRISKLESATTPLQQKNIERITIFYTDGTFKNYTEN